MAWDRELDTGFQLVGTVEQMLDLAMLNGFLPEEKVDVPQVECKLIIRVRQMMHFSNATTETPRSSNRVPL